MALNAFQLLCDFISELKKLGVSSAVISPGSRNAPIIKALEINGFEQYSAVDERSAAFIALGMAKASSVPVILTCTSGTALLNYYPAIAEAFYSQTPIIILSADRPLEQIDQWEGQSIRQTNVFSNHIRYQSTLDLYAENILSSERKKMSNLLKKGLIGPVHWNIPLREPLYQFSENSKMRTSNPLKEKKPTLTSATDISNYLSIDFYKDKVLFFSGMECGEYVRFETEGAPLLCDVTAGYKGNIKFWDGILFTSIKKLNQLSHLQPDVLISSGNTTVSKGLRLFLKKFKPQKHYHISNCGEVGDMFGSNPQLIQLNKNFSKNEKSEVQSTYKMLWFDESLRFKSKMNLLIWNVFNEFSAIKQILNSVDEHTVLHFSNSMPIRYASLLNTHNVICNRGASGIDGCTSTAVGYACKNEKLNILITGDIAFLYDVNALWFESFPFNLRIIVMNNQGGGIFEMIEGPKNMGESLTYQTTPHQRNIKTLAAHFGISYFCASNFDELSIGMNVLLNTEECVILEVKTNRKLDQQFFQKFKQLSE